MNLVSMTNEEDDNEKNEVLPELGPSIESQEHHEANDSNDDDNNNEDHRHQNTKGGYVKLKVREEEEHEPPPERCSCGSIWYWVKLGLLFTCLGILAGVFIKWVGPFFMNKEVIPIINWETDTFSKPVLAVLIFVSAAIFPTLLLPTSPSMWVAGIAFGYGIGFLLIFAGMAVGVSLPYFIGSLFLYGRIHAWLEKYPKKAAVLRAAGGGNWFHQFRAVALIRISPFPYIIYNYCAVATNVKYGPYICGTLVGVVPEIFVTLYTGILIRTLATATHHKQFLSVPQIIFNLIGFVVAVATTVFFTMYAKKQLKAMQKEEDDAALLD